MEGQSVSVHFSSCSEERTKHGSAVATQPGRRWFPRPAEGNRIPIHGQLIGILLFCYGTI